MRKHNTIQYNTIQIKFLRRRNFGAVQKESLTSGHRNALLAVAVRDLGTTSMSLTIERSGRDGQ